MDATRIRRGGIWKAFVRRPAKINGTIKPKLATIEATVISWRRTIEQHKFSDQTSLARAMNGQNVSDCEKRGEAPSELYATLQPLLNTNQTPEQTYTAVRGVLSALARQEILKSHAKMVDRIKKEAVSGPVLVVPARRASPETAVVIVKHELDTPQ